MTDFEKMAKHISSTLKDEKGTVKKASDELNKATRDCGGRRDEFVRRYRDFEYADDEIKGLREETLQLNESYIQNMTSLVKSGAKLVKELAKSSLDSTAQKKIKSDLIKIIKAYQHDIKKHQKMQKIIKKWQVKF